MRIAIFSDTFFPSVNGVANVVYNSALSLLKRGHEIQLYTCSKDPKDKLEDNFKGRIAHVVLPSLPFWGYSGEKITLFSGKSLLSIRKFKPQIIHTHTPFSAGWEAIFASKINNIKLVGTHHTFYDDYLKYIKIDNAAMKKFSWQYTVFYYNHCNLTISPSKSLADELKAHDLKGEIKILPNPIDVDLFSMNLKLSKEELKKRFKIKGKSIVYMGRLSYEKNIEQVISVFSEILKIDSSVSLMIIGDGPHRKNLEEFISKLDVGSNIVFTGLLREQKLVEALRANDVFVTASKSENMPLAVLETMACGLPAVTASDRGLKEVVKDKINGYLADFSNKKDTAKKILTILKNEKLSEKFSTSSRNLSIEYSEEVIVEKLEEIYNKILK